MSNMWKEFKEFAVKGNAIDLAVGVIIGAAFGSIVTSLVKDILMPPVGLVTGGLDFSNKFLVLKAGADGMTNSRLRLTQSLIRRSPGITVILSLL